MKSKLSIFLVFLVNIAASEWSIGFDELHKNLADKPENTQRPKRLLQLCIEKLSAEKLCWQKLENKDVPYELLDLISKEWYRLNFIRLLKKSINFEYVEDKFANQPSRRHNFHLMETFPNKPPELEEDGSLEHIKRYPEGGYVVAAHMRPGINLWGQVYSYHLYSRQLTHMSRLSSPPIISTAISNDQKFIVMGEYDGAEILDLSTGKIILSLDKPSSPVLSVAISNDDKYVVTGSRDKTARIWNLNTGKKILSLDKHSSSVTSVAISNDKRYVVTGTCEGIVKIWDFDSGKERITLSGHKDGVTPIVISQNGKYIITGSYDRTIKMWHSDKVKEQFKLKDKYSDVSLATLELSNNIKYVVIGSRDGTIDLWDLNTGQLVNCRKKIIPLEPIMSISISNDKKYIIAGVMDGVYIFNMRSLFTGYEELPDEGITLSSLIDAEKRIFEHE